MKLLRISVPALIPLALIGCTCSNPREGGFVGGVCGVTTGSYQQRVDDRERELHRVNSDRRNAEATNELLMKEHDARSWEFQYLRREVDALDIENRQLYSYLQRLETRTSTARVEQQKVAARLVEINHEVNKMKNSSSYQQPDEAIAEYRKNAQQLRQEIENLWVIINTLD